MGSSCFSRGNSDNLGVIRDYLKSHKLEARIRLSGSRCEGKCLNGPNILIDGKLFQNVHSDTIVDILNDELSHEG
jgi:NADH:ubiquinone oxidoreductase subunit E